MAFVYNDEGIEAVDHARNAKVGRSFRPADEHALAFKFAQGALEFDFQVSFDGEWLKHDPSKGLQVGAAAFIVEPYFKWSFLRKWTATNNLTLTEAENYKYYKDWFGAWNSSQIRHSKATVLPPEPILSHRIESTYQHILELTREGLQVLLTERRAQFGPKAEYSVKFVSSAEELARKAAQP